MPTINTSLGHEFTVSTVTGLDFTTDTFLNIIKRREEIRYKTSVDEEATNVSFITSQELASSVNLSIADRSTSLAANRTTEIDSTIINASTSFSVSTESFVVTDVFAAATNTTGVKPLYYKHTLSTTNVPRDTTSTLGLDLATGVTLVAVEILDQFLQPIKVSEKLLDSTQGLLYNNLLSEFISTGDFTVYFVKYSVNNNGVITTYVDLLDNTTAFRQATFDDLDGSLEIIQDGRKVYFVEEAEDGFTVTLPIISTYAFRPLSAARIQVINPVGTTSSDSWFVRVTNGTFFTNLSSVLHKYYIAEFLTQVFSPEPPIKNVDSETSTVLNSSLIKLDQENIFQDTGESLFIEVLISDSSGTAVAAFSTDPSLTDTVSSNGKIYQIWNITDRTGIRSVDGRTGILEIEGISLLSTYVITSSYNFTETNYEFTLFNFNPISNRSALTHKIALFIDPELSTENKDQTLFFLKIDEAGKVVESNWEDFDNTLMEYFPSGVDKPSTPLYYEAIPDFIAPSGAEGIFIERHTVEATGIQTDNFLVLGDITTSEAFGVTETTKIDSRVRGGGIVEGSVATAIESNPEIQWYWDEGYWDGTPYPANSSYLVEVPAELLLDTPSGIFTQQEVKDVVDRHAAFGVYPVVKVYGVDVTVTGVEPGAGTLKLEWFSNV